VDKIEYRDPRELKENQYSRKIFPILEGKQYELLREDIREHGIRIPVEITKGNMILCGHERVKVALDLGIPKIPVVVFASDDDGEQKIEIIKDNLARKSIDFNTKYKCFEELKQLYGLREGRPRKTPSEEGVSEEEIAMEVGLHQETFRRAQKVQRSDLPSKVKDAVFKGNLPVRPIAEIVDKPKSIKKQIVEKLEEELEQNPDGEIQVAPIVRSVESKHETEKVLEEMGVPSVSKQIEQFYEKLPSPKAQKEKPIQQSDLVKHILSMVQTQKLKCPVCGETKIAWKCGHEFK
jgi:ParB-like chromosome segregation protein Spo0J